MRVSQAVSDVAQPRSSGEYRVTRPTAHSGRTMSTQAITARTQDRPRATASAPRPTASSTRWTSLGARA